MQGGIQLNNLQSGVLVACCISQAFAVVHMPWVLLWKTVLSTREELLCIWELELVSPPSRNTLWLTLE